MMLLKECRAPPNATISFVLLNNPEYLLEWSRVPSSGRRSSLCRDFYAFLYGSDDGYDEAKQLLNNDGMFILFDEKANHVRVVVQDQAYDVKDAPSKFKRVAVPSSVKQLLRGSNYVPTGKATDAVVGGKTNIAAPGAAAPNEVANNLVLGRLFGNYVKPNAPGVAWVSTIVPGTFYEANEGQRHALRVSLRITNGTPQPDDPKTLPADIRTEDYSFRMHVGSPEIVLPIVWGVISNLRQYRNKPWVYYYSKSDRSGWRYFRDDKDPPLVLWSKGVFIDKTLVQLSNSEFDLAYSRCMDTIIDFAKVVPLYNIFYLIKEYDLLHAENTKSTELELMMKRSHIMCTEDLRNILELTLKTVKKSEHVVKHVYYELKDWRALARRLLTKRVLWYYGTDDTWGYNTETLFGVSRVNGQGPESYIQFASKMGWENYLHPDESIISSLLGIKVPSFAYDIGTRTAAGQTPPTSFDTKVIMLGQVGARLEPHKILRQGDLILVDDKVPCSTPFQCALKDGLAAMGRADLYTARCCVVLQQAIDAARNHSEPTHLMLTGLGQGVWQGNYGNKTVPAFSNALLHTVLQIQDKKNLKSLTLFDYDPKELYNLTPFIVKLLAACEAKGIDFKFENNFYTEVFGRKPGQGLVDMYSFAWDGMSLVGNEYYHEANSCGWSADPAAACSTSVAFLAHPRINPDMYTRFKPFDA